MSAGMCRTSRLSAGAYHTVLVRRCMRILRIVRAARAVVMRQYRTAQDCSRAGACCTYEPLACMRATSYRIAGMWVYIIQSYVCRRTPHCACLQVYAIQRSVCGHVPYIAFVCRCVPYHTELCLQAYTVQCVLVCRCMPYSAMSAGMYHTSRLSVGVYRIVQRYVCKRIPYSACLRVYAIQRYVCGHVPYIVLVCRCMPYRAITAGVCVYVV